MARGPGQEGEPEAGAAADAADGAEGGVSATEDDDAGAGASDVPVPTTWLPDPAQVWAADITYIPMARGFLHLVAIMDWHSRYVLFWRLSNTLDAGFCVDALEEALRKAKPEICNTDQGSRFTGDGFSGMLEERGISISMDGKGSYNDNLFIEHLWRTVKYEAVYLKTYLDGREAKAALAHYFYFYSNERPHQALGYRTPAAV